MLRPTRLLLPVLVVLGLLAAPRAARADIGLGLFLGEPTGLDIKIGLAARSAIDVVLGLSEFDDDSGGYGHLTYLVTPFAGRGRAVIVPFRVGIGAALYEGFGDDLAVAARAPLEVGFVFTRTPIELYLELAFKITFINAPDDDDVEADLDGGLGIRFYF
jgi:hypothetical protein